MRLHDVLTDLVCEPVAMNLADYRGVGQDRPTTIPPIPATPAAAPPPPPLPGASLNLEGEAHGGMFEAATRFRDEVGDRIRTALEQHPGYSLTLTGQ